MKEIWAIILAAGESKRMKVPKMLLPFDGQTMVEKVILNVTGSNVSDTMVVLGSFRDEIQGAIRHLPVKHCYNEKYRNGMLSSVRCGLENLPGSWDAALIVPGDQPFIGPEVINKIIEAYLGSGKGIIIPVYRKKRGHPLLLDHKYREMISKLSDNEGLNSIAHKFPEDLFEISTRSQGILKDFDTKQDYLNEINNSQYGTKNKI